MIGRRVVAHRLGQAAFAPRANNHFAFPTRLNAVRGEESRRNAAVGFWSFESNRLGAVLAELEGTRGLGIGPGTSLCRQSNAVRRVSSHPHPERRFPRGFQDDTCSAELLHRVQRPNPPAVRRKAAKTGGPARHADSCSITAERARSFGTLEPFQRNFLSSPEQDRGPCDMAGLTAGFLLTLSNRDEVWSVPGKLFDDGTDRGLFSVSAKTMSIGLCDNQSDRSLLKRSARNTSMYTEIRIAGVFDIVAKCFLT